MHCPICETQLPKGAKGETCSKSCAARLRYQRNPRPRKVRSECLVDGCDGEAARKSLCGKHYQRWLKHGDLERHDQPMSPDRQRARHRWQAMRRRCTDPTARSYNRYGGRGIKVCARWMNFDLYWQDVGNPPADGMSLDRIDNDGDYEPGNVRWSDAKAQAANRGVKPRPSECPHGHAYTPENTYEYPDGRWACCTCYPYRKRRMTEEFGMDERKAVGHE